MWYSLTPKRFHISAQWVIVTDNKKKVAIPKDKTLAIRCCSTVASVCCSRNNYVHSFHRLCTQRFPSARWVA